MHESFSHLSSLVSSHSSLVTYKYMPHAHPEHPRPSAQASSTGGELDQLKKGLSRASEQGAEAAKHLLVRGVEVKKQLAEMGEQVEASPLGQMALGGMALLKEAGFFKREKKKKGIKPPVKPSEIPYKSSPPSPGYEASRAVSSAPAPFSAPISDSLVSQGSRPLGPSISSGLKRNKERLSVLSGPSLGQAINRKGAELRKNGLEKGLVEDHTHNAALLSLLNGKEQQVHRFLEKYQANKARYEKVSRVVNLPPLLIAALHQMESSMNFNTYLHNGQKLGRETTFVPKGILFHKDQWEEAAIHALGGNIVDAKGNPSKPYFQNLRKKIGITAETKDLGKMMTFAERYNGLGYRSKNILSAYVYGGTNLMQTGRFVADGKFDPTQTSPRVGVAGLLLAGEGQMS